MAFGCPNCGCQETICSVPACRVTTYDNEGNTIDVDLQESYTTHTEKCATCMEPFDHALWQNPFLGE